jgi:hypothetical protein
MVLGVRTVCAMGQPAQTCVPSVGQYQPFSAISSVTTLDDHGKLPTKACCGLLQHDSEGRSRIAHVDAADFDRPIRSATIYDPIALRVVSINYVSRTAMIASIPATNARKMLPPERPFASDDPKREDLGEKMIDGLKAHGYGWTERATSGAGRAGAASAKKASRFSAEALPVIYQRWWSPQLRIYLLQITRDANGNEQMIRHEKIQLKEPEPGTFSIPDGFQVTTAAPGP